MPPRRLFYDGAMTAALLLIHLALSTQARAAGLAELDSALDRADADAKELSQVLASAGATLKSTPIDPALDYRQAFMQNTRDDCRAAFRAADVPTAALDHELGRPVTRYLACQAVAAKTHAACTAHPTYSQRSPLGGGESAAQNCLDGYFIMRFARGPDPVGICKQANAVRGGRGNAAVICAEFAAGMCAGAPALSWLPFDDAVHCEAVLGALRGDESVAKRGAKYDELEFAYTTADVAAVHAARKSGACGGSAICAALLSGKLKDCAPLLNILRDDYCDRQVKRKSGTGSSREWSDKRHQARAAAMSAVIEKRKSLDARLVALGAALDGYQPKTQAGFAARVARYRALRRMVDGELERFRSVAEPAKSAPKPRKSR